MSNRFPVGIAMFVAVMLVTAVSVVLLGVAGWMAYDYRAKNYSGAQTVQQNYQAEPPEQWRSAAPGKPGTNKHKPNCQHPKDEGEAALCVQYAQVDEARLGRLMSEAIGRDGNGIAFTTILSSIFGTVISALALVIAAIAARDAARSVEMGSGGSRPFLDLSVGTASPRQVTITNGGNTPAFIEKIRVCQVGVTDPYMIGAAPAVETFACPRIIASGGEGVYLGAAGVPNPASHDLIVEVVFRDAFDITRSYWKRFAPNGSIWEQKESGDQQHV